MNKETKLNKMDTPSSRENKDARQQPTPEIPEKPELGHEDFVDFSGFEDMYLDIPNNEGEPWGLEGECEKEPDFSFLDKE